MKHEQGLKLIATHGRWEAGDTFFYDSNKYRFNGMEPGNVGTLHATRMFGDKGQITFSTSRDWHSDTQTRKRNADSRTQHEQAALERRARFAYGHDWD